MKTYIQLILTYLYILKRNNNFMNVYANLYFGNVTYQVKENNKEQYGIRVK